MSNRFQNLSPKEIDLLKNSYQGKRFQYVSGKAVTVGQAKEIIRRTDQYFILTLGSGVHQFDNYWRKEHGLYFVNQHDVKYWKHLYGNSILTNWVANLDNTFSGWVRPNGCIGSRYVVDMTYPELVYEDWCDIAEAFPFLELGVSYGEDSSPDSIKTLSLLIHNGYVQIMDPRKFNVHEDYPNPPPEMKRLPGILPTKSDLDVEAIHPQMSAVPLSWMREWAALAAKLRKLHVMA